MHALDIGSPHENLAIGLGQRQFLKLATGDLQRDMRLGPTLRVGLVVVRPQDRLDQTEDAAQDTVVIDTGDSLEPGPDVGGQCLGGFLARVSRQGQGGVELGAGQFQQAAGNIRIGRQRLFLNRLRRIESSLLAIPRAGPQESGIAPADAELRDQTVETVVFRAIVEHGEQGFLEHDIGIVGLGTRTRALHLKVMHKDDRLGLVLAIAVPAHFKAGFLQDGQAHIFQHGHHIGQRHRFAGLVDFQMQLARAVTLAVIDAHGEGIVLGQALDFFQVADRFCRRIGFPVAGTEGPFIGPDMGPIPVADRLAGEGFKVIFPGAREHGDAPLQLADVGFGVLIRIQADDEMHARQRAVTKLRIIGREPPVERVADHFTGLFADLRIVAVARDEKQDRDKAVKSIAANKDLGARPVVEMENPQADRQQIILIGLKELVARIIFDNMAQLFLAVRAGNLAGTVQHPPDLATDQGHIAGHPVVGVCGKQADEAVFPDHHAVVAIFLDADIVHVNAAVDARLDIGLGDDQRG